MFPFSNVMTCVDVARNVETGYVRQNSCEFYSTFICQVVQHGRKCMINIAKTEHKGWGAWITQLCQTLVVTFMH
jgi:hypothetical protein